MPPTPKITEIYPTVEELVSSNDLTCLLCLRSFSNAGAKRMHYVKTHRIVERASDIGLRSRTIKTSSDDEFRYYCPVALCRKWFKSKKLLTQHFYKMHQERKFECEKCSAKFSLERDLKYHMNRSCPVNGVVQGSSSMFLLSFAIRLCF